MDKLSPSERRAVKVHTALLVLTLIALIVFAAWAGVAAVNY